jgi:tellurite resistance protein
MTPEQKVDLLRAACCVAGIDGETSPKEQQLIDKLAKNVGCGSASVTAMVARSQQDPEFYRDQFKVLKEDPQQAMAVLLEVAMADGALQESEKSVLVGLANNLNVPSEIVDKLVSEVSGILKQDQSTQPD